MIYIKKTLKKVLLIIISFIVLISIGFIIWAENSYKPSTNTKKFLKSSSSVIVSNDENIIFKPKDKTCTKGFIFYPGAKVEPESYSELCSKIAESGYLVVIVKMPLNLAILSPNKADEIIKEYSNIKQWAIGGHSLGGVMAANYAADNKEIKGLIFMASYPQGNVIKNSDISVLSIYGSNDGVANKDKIKGASLPENSKIVEIKGGNHADFGDYGSQKRDNKASISRKEQIDYTSSLVNKFMEKL